MEYNYLGTVVKILNTPARQNKFIEEDFFNNAPVQRMVFAMKTKSAVTGLNIENPFSYMHLQLRQLKILKGGQSIVDFDAANCRLYVTTMEAMNFQDVIPSILTDNFKDHYALVFALTSLQDATENLYPPEVIGEPLRLGLNFTFLLEHFNEFLVLVEQILWLQLTFPVTDTNTLQQIFNSFFQLKTWYLRQLFSVYFTLITKETVTSKNRQESKKRSAFWITDTNFCDNWYF